MKILLETAHSPIDWYSGSTTLEILSSQSGLRVVIASTEEHDLHVAFQFAYVHAFQVLHERDMADYWSEPLPSRHMLFRVVGGGWIERCSSDYLQATANFNSNEWLLVSDTGPCVTIIADKEPFVLEY